MAWIYLIGEVNTPNKFKIGLTTENDVEKRLKKLQTGNGEELYISKQYKTDTPFKLEKMLHNHFANKKVLNEWFLLEESDYKDFINICNKKQEIINSIKDNPFFKNN